ncbi:unnamed protein product [Rhodiola kirilowii]
MNQQEKPQRPIKYGDVFQVSGQLATEPIPTGDAATVQAAENLFMGQTYKGGPDAAMQSAARKNIEAGHVDRGQTTEILKQEGVSVSDTDAHGHRIVTEALGGQVLGQYVRPEAVETVEMKSPVSAEDRDDVITIGEALEVTTMSAGDKVVDQSDAAAIQAAEARATGSYTMMPGGVAAMAQSAVTLNERIVAEEQKITLSDVLTDAAKKLPGDRAVTREDAEGVIGAEIKNHPNLTTYPGGVAASMATAARHNQT